MIPGIDVSHWQREIDWAAVAHSGVRFAFIKATEFVEKRTELHVDEMLAKNISGATSAGIHWGAYHIFRTHIDPIIQAQAFCESVGEFTSLPPAVQIVSSGISPERLNRKIEQFLLEVEKITGKKPVIFTNSAFWTRAMAQEKLSQSDWARDYPIWISQHTSLWPQPLYPWAGWDFWQYTDNGHIPGISTDVHMNWFNGSEDDLKLRFGMDSQIRGETAGFSKNIGSKNSNGQHFKTGAEVNLDDLDNFFRGDFQEPHKQHRHIQVQREKTDEFTGNDDNNVKEEEWIKMYFLQ